MIHGYNTAEAWRILSIIACIKTEKKVFPEDIENIYKIQM